MFCSNNIVQSNLSKPYHDKTEHLPKPNDFRGPEFFPYYSLLKKPEQETPQCDENQVFNDSTKYLCDRKKK